MPELARLDTSVFDRSIRPLLHQLPADKIPQALNRKMFFVGLEAIRQTEKVFPLKIVSELMRSVTLKRDDDSTDSAPIGYALAARRAHKDWPTRVEKLSSRKRRPNMAREWQKLVAKKFQAMLGSRARSAAFIRAGWAGAIAAIAPFVRNKSGQSYERSDVRRRGAPKGRGVPAKPGWSPFVILENTAQAKSDHAGGLIKHGQPALQRAFDKEMADWIPYLEKEVLKEEVEKFNAAQH